MKKLLISLGMAAVMFGQQQVPSLTQKQVKELTGIQKKITEMQVEQVKYKLKGYELDRKFQALVKEYRDASDAAKLVDGCGDCQVTDGLTFQRNPPPPAKETPATKPPVEPTKPVEPVKAEEKK